jgi:endonuclease YncB( thermonuclease family)
LFGRRDRPHAGVVCPCPTAGITAQVVAVHDGDTITVRTTAETLKVRVAGVDCPEIGQPWSSRAKQFTSQLVFGRTVTIETHGTDQYGRMIGRVSSALAISARSCSARNGVALRGWTRR